MTKVYAQVRGQRGDVTSSAQSTTKSSKPIDPSQTNGALFSLFMFVVLLWLLGSAAIVYHFRKYGKGDNKVAFAQAIYFIISLILLAVMVFAI